MSLQINPLEIYLQKLIPTKFITLTRANHENFTLRNLIHIQYMLIMVAWPPPNTRMVYAYYGDPATTVLSALMFTINNPNQPL